MDTFIDEIIADMEWRIGELATIKSLPIKYGFSQAHKEIHVKYSIPALYAVFEGYVKNTFLIYANHLNSLSIDRKDISLNLLAHNLDSECNFSNPRESFDSKKKLVKLIDSILIDKITIISNVPTKSNLNYKVLCNVLERFCINRVDVKYDNMLSKLLKFRNMIAHGENAIVVTIEHVTEFVNCIENLMMDILINIEQCFNSMSYKAINDAT